MKYIRYISLFLVVALLGVAWAGDTCCPVAPVASASAPAPAANTHAGHAHADNSHAGHAHAAPAPTPARGDDDKEEGHGHEGHAHAGHAHAGHAHAGHAHAHAVVGDPMTVKCEHNIRQIECDECRYELGVVKVAATATALLRVEPVQVVGGDVTIELNGELAFDENRVRCITPRFAGRLASLSVRVGDPVRAGEPLIVLESQDLAQAALDLRKRGAEAALAQKRFDREASLFAKKIGSEQDMQEAQSARDLANIECENAQRRLSLFGLDARRIGALTGSHRDPAGRGEMTILSPLSGRVIRRDGNIGDMVPADKELVVLADVTHLWAIAQVHENNMATVLTALGRGGVRGEITVAAFPGRTWEATAFGADAQLNTDTRTLPLRLLVENHDETLRPGMFVKVRLLVGNAGMKPTLPTAAILEDAGETFVFVKGPEDYYFKRSVVVGKANGPRTPVESGLKDGERVVVEGAFLLKSDILREKMGAGCAD